MWKSPAPIEKWSKREEYQFLKETWTRLKFLSFTWDPGVILALTMTTYTIGATSGDLITSAVTGLRIGMPVKLTSPSAPSPGLVWDACVTANDQVTVWIQNLSIINVNAPSGLWSIIGMVI